MRAIANQLEATCSFDQESRFESQPLQQIRQACCLSSLRPSGDKHLSRLPA